jgi:hypothetical protein
MRFIAMIVGMMFSITFFFTICGQARTHRLIKSFPF